MILGWFESNWTRLWSSLDFCWKCECILSNIRDFWSVLELVRVWPLIWLISNLFWAVLHSLGCFLLLLLLEIVFLLWLLLIICHSWLLLLLLIKFPFPGTPSDFIWPWRIDVIELSWGNTWWNSVWNASWSRFFLGFFCFCLVLMHKMARYLKCFMCNWSVIGLWLSSVD